MPEPFLKWPGGKRWLVQKYPKLFPSEVKRHIEPFLGGGAVFFHQRPKFAILADANSDLILTYKMIRDRAADLHSELVSLHKTHCAKRYYAMRCSQPKSDFGRVLRFLYLNRTCFNGIYRVNLKGQFNVPMGSKSLVAFPDGYLQEVSLILSEVDLRCSDFGMTVRRATKGDFLYVDPPYTVMHNNNNFVKYNDVLFSWADQERLAAELRDADGRGVRILVSNANHASVRSLYKGLGEFHVVGRASILAASSGARCATTELAITNY